MHKENSRNKTEYHPPPPVISLYPLSFASYLLLRVWLEACCCSWLLVCVCALVHSSLWSMFLCHLPLVVVPPASISLSRLAATCLLWRHDPLRGILCFHAFLPFLPVCLLLVLHRFAHFAPAHFLLHSLAPFIAGDSRAVLCRNGKAVALTRDHKADRPDELERIKAAGGRHMHRHTSYILFIWPTPAAFFVLCMCWICDFSVGCEAK